MTESNIKERNEKKMKEPKKKKKLRPMHARDKLTPIESLWPQTLKSVPLTRVMMGILELDLKTQTML